MAQKVQYAICKAYVKSKYELNKLMHEENGDGEVSKVVYIAIAVIGALILFGLLFGDKKDGKGGVIGKIFEGINKKIDEIFKIKT